MKRERFSEEQIIEILKLHSAGAKPADLCRQHGISEATLYRWKQQYGAMELDEVKELKALRDEDARLKRLVADQALNIQVHKEVNAKKW